MAQPRKPRAFTTRATRSLPLTGRCFGNGIWFSPSVQRIANAVVRRRNCYSSGESGVSILVWPLPTRRRIDLNHVHRHVHRAAKGLLPWDEPRRKTVAPHPATTEKKDGE